MSTSNSDRAGEHARRLWTQVTAALEKDGLFVQNRQAVGDDIHRLFFYVYVLESLEAELEGDEDLADEVMITKDALSCAAFDAGGRFLRRKLRAWRDSHSAHSCTVYRLRGTA
jgi:hypothetical protein